MDDQTKKKIIEAIENLPIDSLYVLCGIISIRVNGFPRNDRLDDVQNEQQIAVTDPFEIT